MFRPPWFRLETLGADSVKSKFKEEEAAFEFWENLQKAHAGMRGAQFQSTCKLCRESHKTQVWLSFLVLSLFSTSCVAETRDLKISVEQLTGYIKKSDAMLYAPSDTKDSCKMMSLECYMSELKMVIIEEGVKDIYTNPIHHFTPTASPDGGCLPCEAHPLENITIFMDKLNNLLEQMITEQHLLKKSTDT